MDIRNRRNQGNTYTPNQIKRVLSGSGLNVEKEAESEYIVFCPFHNNHRTPAGEINKYSGLFFCFSCSNTSDLVELVMHCSGRSYFESVRFIKSKEVETNIETDINKKLIPKDEWQEFDSSVVSRLHNNLMLSDRAKSYFVSRKIVGESLNKFILGYSDKQDMVTVPVHSPEGILVGFVGRSIEGKDFKNTPGLPKSKLLFNLHRVKNANRVYVVESSFDVMRLNQVGLPAVATLGANVSYRQIDLLQKYFSDIMIIADNDEAGGNMKEKIIEKLGSHVSVININKQYKDIGDMDDMSIKELDLQFDKSIMSMLK